MRLKDRIRKKRALRHPVRIGLTGGVGSGKSRVLTILAKKGIPTLRTDRVGHSLLRRPSVQRRLGQLFGKAIILPGGGVDRKEIGRRVFQDRRKRRGLNILLHPLIRQEVSNWVRRRSRRRPVPSLLVVEVPLLFEGGYYRWFDGTVSVSAPLKVRRKRLVDRGWSLLEMKRRESAQWTQREKDLAADKVIYNRGSLNDLEWSVEDWLRKLRSEKR